MIRRIDDLGRVAIPKEIREAIGVRENDKLEIVLGNNGTILVRKYVNSCVFCSATQCLEEYKRKYLCLDCAKEIGRGVK